MMDLFEYATTLRDHALEQVTRHDWMTAACRAFHAYKSELPDVFTGEDIRELVMRHSFAPHHPNAWGALTMKLVKQEFISPTGTFTKMKSPSSHARRTFEYRLVG